MLVWSRSGQVAAKATMIAIVAIIYAAPIAMIVLASVAGEWNGVLPSKLTLAHFANVGSAEAASELRASLITALVASLAALVSGTWAALALRPLSRGLRRVLEALFFLPSAVPSVSVGLGLLVAYSRPPLLLNGTTAIVVIAHFVLIAAFTFGAVSAGLARLPADIEQVAESLGAPPALRLRRVTLPMLAPYLVGAFSLSVALSMGELGATAMVYPPGWVTLPVGIFALTDRGAVFDGAALTVVLAMLTVAILVLLARLPLRAITR
jgi:2-aminoethylphosphonate transport system permease protein